MLQGSRIRIAKSRYIFNPDYESDPENALLVRKISILFSLESFISNKFSNPDNVTSLFQGYYRIYYR